MNNIKSPFICCIQKAIPLTYDESLSYYETLCALVHYLKEVVTPKLNETITGLAELEEYVNNYFTNLDVQEEINNKLDEMAESGQLTDIIAQYLQLAGALCYDTVSDMKSANNVVNGSYAITYGYNSLNDGGNAKYKIRNITNDDIVDEMTIIALSDENLIAELIIDKLNVKQLGAKGDGIQDDTTYFTKACSLENTSVYVTKGTYKITSAINMAVGNKIYGDKNCIITTANTSINLFNINRYCDIKGIKFVLPQGYNANVCELSFKTIDAQSPLGLYNDVNVHIDDIDFLFDLDINTVSNKTGNCFLISADETESNIKYNGKGYWGVYISNIFVKGACESVIKQYDNKGQDNWITGCYYNNFNIDSAPLYGFLGFKDIDNIDYDYTDGQMIYFNNWQMQCGKSHSMFAFSYPCKYMYNIIPWDWAYKIDPEDKPFAILYRSDISVTNTLDYSHAGNIYDNCRVLELPIDVNFWKWISTVFTNFKNISDTFNTEIYKGHYVELTKDGNAGSVQTILANENAEVAFQLMSSNGINLGIDKQGNGLIIGKGVHTVMVNYQLHLFTTENYYISIFKNTSQIDLKQYSKDISIPSGTNILNVSEGDVITIKVIAGNADASISQNGDVYNYLKVVSLA